MRLLATPLPGHIMHTLSDETLKDLIKLHRECMTTEGWDKEKSKEIIENIYKVLGYRCALEYLERYGD